MNQYRMTEMWQTNK